MGMKRCKHPEHEGKASLPLSEFQVDRRFPDGRKMYCKTCVRKKSQKWYEEKSKNPEWRQEKNEKAKLYRNGSGKINAMYAAAKSRAKARNIEFTITHSDIVIPMHCPILGMKLSFDTVERDNSPSIDRIDNSKGYTPDNIQIISWRANYLKSSATLDELKLLAQFAEAHSP